MNPMHKIILTKFTQNPKNSCDAVREVQGERESGLGAQPKRILSQKQTKLFSTQTPKIRETQRLPLRQPVKIEIRLIYKS